MLINALSIKSLAPFIASLQRNPTSIRVLVSFNTAKLAETIETFVEGYSLTSLIYKKYCECFFF